MVNAAHEGLQASALTIFPPETFDGVDPEGVGRALASLILCDFAAQRNQTTQWIEPDRDEALRTLAVRLTPTGQEALLQSLENSQGDNAFSKYFAHADSQYFAQADAYCLAGHLYFQRAGTPLLAGSIDRTPEDASAQAAGDYLKAADLFTRAGQPDLAAEAYLGAADAYRGSFQPLKAAEVCLRAADLYTQTSQPLKAADARLKAAAAYLTAANGYLLAGAPGVAGDAYLRAADLYMQTHQPMKAVDICQKAADAYRGAGEPGQAAVAHLWAAHAVRADADARPEKGRYAQAAAAYVRAAQAYTDVEQPGPAADAWLWAALASTRAREPRKALAAYQQAAEANTKAGRHGLAGDVWRSVADLYTELGDPKLASDANDNAATVYRWAAIGGTEVRQPLPAAHYYLMAAEAHAAVAQHARDENAKDVEQEHKELAEEAYEWAGDAFMGDGLPAAATHAYMLAGQYARAIVPCAQAARHYLAADELLQAADAYTQLGFALRAAGEPTDKGNKAFLTAAGLYQRERAYLAAAVAYAEGGDFLQAAPLFERVNRPAPAGHAYLQSKMFPQAARAFWRANRLEPDAERRERLRLLAESTSEQAVLFDRNL
ncbi:hypothetical protein [Pandoraea vervacti]|nr:hypothetical protein [Pandoraea vervacti]